MLLPHLDGREYYYGCFGDFDVPDDGVEYSISSEWLVDRICVWTSPGATGAVLLNPNTTGGGGDLAVGNATSFASLDLHPAHLYRGGVRVRHDVGTGGTLRIRIEYAYKTQVGGLKLPVTVLP